MFFQEDLATSGLECAHHSFSKTTLFPSLGILTDLVWKITPNTVHPLSEEFTEELSYYKCSTLKTHTFTEVNFRKLHSVTHCFIHLPQANGVNGTHSVCIFSPFADFTHFYTH